MDTLSAYIRRFATYDSTDRPTPFASEAFLREHLPRFTCSDKVIEELYYFRAYTFAKHIERAQPDGRYIITEFSVPVPWATRTEQAIACPVGHQLRELRWLRDMQPVGHDYIDFWLDHIDGLLTYNNWFVSAVWDYACVSGDLSFVLAQRERLISYVDRQIAEHETACGLFKGVDNYDGMELSISSHGLRPTINAYVFANTRALADLLELTADPRAAAYRTRAEGLRARINKHLFIDDFYYSRPLPEGERDANYDPAFANPTPTWEVRELCGYVPFYFGIPDRTHTVALRYLTDPQVFAAPFGLTSADMSHPQFDFPFHHSCRWSGPVWPFATSQTLTGVIKYLQIYDNLPITPNNFVDMLHTYADAQHITQDGVRRPFIDEDLDGHSGAWLAKEWVAQREAHLYPKAVASTTTIRPSSTSSLPICAALTPRVCRRCIRWSAIASITSRCTASWCAA